MNAENAAGQKLLDAAGFAVDPPQGRAEDGKMGNWNDRRRLRLPSGGTMAEAGCGDGSAVQGMAAELFQLASLLVGDEQRALRLIESSLATMEIDPCLDPETANQQARAHVVRGALAQLAAEQPEAFASHAAGLHTPGTSDPCIQDDDLQAAGITPAQLRGWLEQQGKPELRRGLREWLESLPVAQRAIFVQRAVLGQGNETAAGLLREAGGAAAGGWTPQTVSETFRQALCSLANSLAHAPVADALPA